MNMKSKWEILWSHLSKLCHCKVKFIRNKRRYQSQKGTSHLDFCFLLCWCSSFLCFQGIKGKLNNRRIWVIGWKWWTVGWFFWFIRFTTILLTYCTISKYVFKIYYSMWKSFVQSKVVENILYTLTNMYNNTIVKFLEPSKYKIFYPFEIMFVSF
jgi:hypothetical protein